ncbi:MAG: 4Fe-4S binding protein, partial [Deltaproteobacteria bacterium]|nr:4Fe-4S binding protein [Deltaproteobacteria bacterium]
MRQRLVVFAAGAFSLAAQTVVLREILVAFHGNELGTGVFFATWLLWVAVGALVGRFAAMRLAEPLRAVGYVALAYLPAVLVQLLAFQWLRPLGGVGPAEVFPLETLVLLAVLLNAPTSFLTGLIFPLAAGATEREATSLYAWESAGSFLGGAGLTVALMWGGSPTATLGAFGLLVAAAILERRTAALAIAAGVACLVLLLGGGRWVETGFASAHLQRLLPGAELLDARDTPKARYAVARLPGQVVVLRDGQVASSHPDPVDAPQEAALAMAESSGARRVLVVGEGSEELVQTLLVYDAVEQVDLVVADPVAHRFLGPVLPEAAQAVREDPRVNVHMGDLRAMLAAPADRRWDLVIVATADPDTAASNRFYTEEFYRQVAGALSPAGVVATQVLSGENFLGAELAAYGGSVLATLETVFPEVVVLPGDPSRFFASPSPGVVTADPHALALRHARLAHRSAFPDAGFASLIDPRRTAFVEEAYRKPDPVGGVLRNTDAHPLSYTLNLLVQGRYAGSGWVRALHGARAAGAWLWGIPLLVFLILRVHLLWANPEPAREGRQLASTMLVATGFSSLSLGILLLFAFQARVGTLFGKLGLMNAVLLAGMAVGAAAGRWATARLDPPAARGPGRLARSPMLALALIGGLAAALPLGLNALPPGPTAEPGFVLMFALAGLVSGAAFPAAAAVLDGDTHPAGTLFAADHFGGAVGAAVVGVGVVPLLGVPGACALLAALQGVVLVLLLAQWWRVRWREDSAVGLVGWLHRWQSRTRVRPSLFPRPGLGYLLAGVAVAALLVGGIAAARLDRPKLTFERLELITLGGAPRYLFADDPFPHYRGGVADVGTDHVILATMGVREDIQGYAGPINLVLVIGADGVYQRVEILESRETPAYVADVIRWVTRVVGRSVREPLALREDGGDIDGVTGATISARAALATVDAVGAEVGRAVLGLPVARPEASGRHIELERGAIYLLLALPLGVWVLLRGSRWVRLGFLAANAVVGGWWLNTQLSLETLAGILRGHPPGLGSPVAMLLVFGIGLLTLLFGAAYCSTLCPFGALQEWIGQLGLTRQVSRPVDRSARAVKYGILTLALAGFALTSDRAFLSFDPLSHAFAGWPSGWPLVLLAMALGGSVVVFRFWCRYLCPVGALVSLGNRVGLARRWLPRRTYGRCDLGVLARDELDCLQCNRCAATVPPSRGPVRPPSSGQPSFRPMVDRPFMIGVALAALLVVGAMFSTRAPEQDTLGGPRDVDIQRIQQLILEHKLSDREA